MRKCENIRNMSMERRYGERDERIAKPVEIKNLRFFFVYTTALRNNCLREKREANLKSNPSLCTVKRGRSTEIEEMYSRLLHPVRIMNLEGL
jgi:hypothetical protein